MAHGGHREPVDVLLKAGIIGVLLAGLILLYLFGGPVGEGVNPTGLLAVGFVVLASHTFGELVEAVKLPHITGYLLAGLVLGASFAHAMHGIPWLSPYLLPPFDNGLLNHEVLAQLGLLDTLALALICLTAGGELKIEALRKGFARILTIMATHLTTVFCGVVLLFVAISGPIPFLVFEPIAGLGMGTVLALGAVLASVMIATSPSATIAIINSVRAQGPVTSNVLPVVVAKDLVVVVAFSAATSVAVGWMPDAGDSGSFLAALVNIGASLVLGVVLGGAIHLYLTYIGAEVLLFIVGMVYAAAEAATALTHIVHPHGHPELALVFIAAGFTMANFSTRGDELIHQVERLSTPVYVLFFTMAGAKLHLEDLVTTGKFAALLVGTRIAMLYVGVRFGATLSGADEKTRKYAWMGFVSQAGLSLTLAGSIQATFPGTVGDGMFSLVLASVALNEVLGPVMLQMALSLAGETADQRQPEVDDPTQTEEHPDAARKLVPWQRRDADPDAWGPAPSTRSAVLNEIAVDLELELRQLVRDLERGPLAEIESDGKEFLRSLRRDFLRFHRHVQASAQQPGNHLELVHYLRAELGELTGRWRDHLLTRQDTVARGVWSPRVLQEAVDQRVSGLPDVVVAPLEPESLTPRDEDTWVSLHRRFLRLRQRLSTVQRQVLVRDLARYHFQGHVAGRMEGLAALAVNAELHLAARTSAIFDTIDRGTDTLADLARRGADTERLVAAIDRVKDAVEEDFTLAHGELEWIGKDSHLRATAVLGRALRQFKEDLLVFDTPDLTRRRRRFALVFDDRTRGLRALTDGLADAWRTAASRYAALALGFEVVGLEGRVKEAVDEHTDRLARQVRGKGITQVERVLEGLRVLLAEVDELLQPGERTGSELSQALLQAVEPVDRVVEEGVESASALRDWLASDASDEPLLDAILAAAQVLTERYDVPVGVPQTGEWALPSPVPTTEIPFREVAISFIEAHVTRDLVEVTRRLSVQVDGLVHALQDLGRVLQFNAQLARSELDVHGGPIGEDTRELVREMLLGAWTRSATRLENAAQEAAPWPEEARTHVRDAVVTKLDDFREQVFDGRITDLRHTLLREVQVRRRLLTEAGNWSAAAGAVGERVSEGFAIALGDERIAAIRHRLGLPEAVQGTDPAAFAEPRTLARLPMVYRRLFSDHALEAGDLLTGREQEYASALQALRPDRHGMFRTVALVGQDAVGKRALANALVRGLGAGRVERRSPTEPVSADTVARWFGADPGGIVLIDRVEALYEMRPGGFAPLEQLIRGIVADGGQTAFVVLFDVATWCAASRATGLDAVFGQVVRMRALSPDELQASLVARHGMSGYELRIDATSDLAWQLQELVSRGDDPGDRNQRAWFKTLHAASGGNLADALRLWMASVVDVDEAHGEIHLGPVPSPPVSRLRRLAPDVLLTLRQVLLEGSATAAGHASAFRVTEMEAEAVLAGLAHAGLLEVQDGRYTVTGHLRTAVVGVLVARGWLG